MSFWLGFALLVVGSMLLVGFGVVDRVVRWLLPESHWKKLEEKGAEIRAHGEAELEHRKAQAKGQAMAVDQAVESTGLSPWAMVLVGAAMIGAVLLVAMWLLPDLWVFGGP